MSGRVLPSLAKRSRSQPPEPPPKRKRSDFGTDEEFEEHKERRRSAKERVREFNRPTRDRTGRARPERKQKQHETFVRKAAALEAKEDQRRIRMGEIVPVGLKCMPPLPPPVHNPKPVNDDDAWCCDYAGNGCLKPLYASPEPEGTWYVWMCEECDWVMCQRCSEAGACARCSHKLLCFDQDHEELE